MTVPQRFPYVARDPARGSSSLMPLAPLTLMGQREVLTTGLVDSGAAVNVLPYSLGCQLGLDWDAEGTAVSLAGNLAAVEARVVVVRTAIGNFPVRRLAFAWARTDAVTVILGQVNFFMEFDVCFFRAQDMFEIRQSDPAC